MNIFALDQEPELAAQAHCDKHIVKMILEYAQLLCSVHHVLGSDTTGLYRLTHKNHPSAKWARASSENYWWLYTLFTHCHNEYMHRYGKGHKSFLDLWERLSSMPAGIPKRHLMPVFLAMPDKFKRECSTFQDSVECYREYYRVAKGAMLTYKKRNPPSWLN